jgi:Mor family transcriptional regulator
MRQGQDSAADDDADIVREILRQVAEVAPQCGPEVMRRIELDVRQRFGGRRWFVAKGKQTRLTPEQRRQAFVDGLGGASTEDIARKHGIDRSTLYRLMKRGGD